MLAIIIIKAHKLASSTAWHLISSQTMLVDKKIIVAL